MTNIILQIVISSALCWAEEGSKLLIGFTNKYIRLLVLVVST